jgi:hypothetical protein
MRNPAVERKLLNEFGPNHLPPKERVIDFAIRNLSVLAYAAGFTLWHYRAGAAGLNQAAHPGFFNDAADMFAAGDMVLVSAKDGGRVLFVTDTKDSITTAPLA